MPPRKPVSAVARKSAPNPKPPSRPRARGKATYDFPDDSDEEDEAPKPKGRGKANGTKKEPKVKKPATRRKVTATREKEPETQETQETQAVIHVGGAVETETERAGAETEADDAARHIEAETGEGELREEGLDMNAVLATAAQIDLSDADKEQSEDQEEAAGKESSGDAAPGPQKEGDTPNGVPQGQEEAAEQKPSEGPRRSSIITIEVPTLQEVQEREVQTADRPTQLPSPEEEEVAIPQQTTEDKDEEASQEDPNQEEEFPSAQRPIEADQHEETGHDEEQPEPELPQNGVAEEESTEPVEDHLPTRRSTRRRNTPQPTNPILFQREVNGEDSDEEEDEPKDEAEVNDEADLGGAILDPTPPPEQRVNVFHEIGRLNNQAEAAQAGRRSKPRVLSEAARQFEAAQAFANQRRLEEDRESDIDESTLHPALVTLRGCLSSETSYRDRTVPHIEEFLSENADVLRALLSGSSTDTELASAHAHLTDIFDGKIQPSPEDLHALSFVLKSLERTHAANKSFEDKLSSALYRHRKRTEAQSDLHNKLLRLLQPPKYEQRAVPQRSKVNQLKLEDGRRQLEEMVRRKREKQAREKEERRRHAEEAQARELKNKRKRRSTASHDEGRRLMPPPSWSGHRRGSFLPTGSSASSSRRSSILSLPPPRPVSQLGARPDSRSTQRSTDDDYEPPVSQLDASLPTTASSSREDSEDIWMSIATSPAQPDRVPVIGQDAPVERVAVDGFGQRRNREEAHSPDSVVLEDRPWSDAEESELVRLLVVTVAKPSRWMRLKQEWDRRVAEMADLHPQAEEKLHPRSLRDLLERAKVIKDALMEVEPEKAAGTRWLQGI